MLGIFHLLSILLHSLAVQAEPYEGNWCNVVPTINPYSAKYVATLLKNTFWVRALQLRKSPCGLATVMGLVFGVSLSGCLGIRLAYRYAGK